MNKQERNKVRRIRTLQAILRAYKNMYTQSTGPSWKVALPPGTDAIDLFKSVGKAEKWHPRRGGDRRLRKVFARIEREEIKGNLEYYLFCSVVN